METKRITAPSNGQTFKLPAWRLMAALASMSLATQVTACGSDEIIGDRKDDQTAGDGDGDVGDGDAPGDGDTTTPGDGDGDGSDAGVTDPEPPTGGEDGGMSGNDEIPECQEGGFLEGENSCNVCCIIDGDVIDWCKELSCTACEQDGLTIEPGATAYKACNTCTCNRDGTISCTKSDCDVDCDADPSQCSYRTDRLTAASYDRGDGYRLGMDSLWGPFVSTPSGEPTLTDAQIVEMQALVDAPAFRDFVRNGTGDCPAIDNYWSQLRSERPAVEERGQVSMSFGWPGKGWTRHLRADCEVDALKPLSDFLDKF